MNAEIQDYILKCSICLQYRICQQKETIKSHELSLGPWEKIRCNLFHCLGQNYLFLVDYYSNFPDICLIKDLQSATVIKLLKSICARYGIPEVLDSDNGPQFASFQFKELCKVFDINHTPSSPEHSFTIVSAMRKDKRVFLRLQHGKKKQNIMIGMQRVNSFLLLEQLFK